MSPTLFHSLLAPVVFQESRYVHIVPYSEGELFIQLGHKAVQSPTQFADFAFTVLLDLQPQVLIINFWETRTQKL